MKKQTFRKMTNRNLNSKKVENTLFREFFIKYSQIPDFEKKRKQEKLLQKHQIMVTIASRKQTDLVVFVIFGHHTFEKRSQNKNVLQKRQFLITIHSRKQTNLVVFVFFCP